MLFPFATLISIIVFVAGLFFITNQVFVVKEEDITAYEELMLDAQPKENESMHDYSVKQQRIGMQKQIFYNKVDQRLQLRLSSGKSELVFKHEDDVTSIMEKMETFKAVIQESVVQNKQQVLYLQADLAVYDYKTEQLSAEKVKIARYEIEGTQFTESFEGIRTLIVGIANSIQFSLSGNGLEFKASEIKATLNSIPKDAS